jgi:hypothetical protein
MAEQRKIRICDDETDRAAVWRSKLLAIPEVAQHYDVEVVPPIRFAAAVTALLERQEATSRGTSPSTADAASVFDETDLLILDMDLTPVPGAFPDLGEEDQSTVRTTLRGLSGESLAYFARCFSNVGFVVVVNQEYGRATFDLTMEKFSTSFADLNVTSDDIVRATLWTGEPEGFRPWHWPRLVDAPDVFQARVDLADPDRAVCDALGLSESDRRALTAEQLDLFDEDDELTKVSFDDLVERAGSGLERKHRQPDTDLRRRIAAGALGRWLDRVLLPAQNVLVDAPHLTQRFPELLGDQGQDAEAWQATCNLGAPTLPLNVLALSAPWADRPIWSLAGARESAMELGGETPAPLDLAFAEDISGFVEFAEAIEFESNVPGPYSQRFCKRVEGVEYKPRQRLLG